MSHAKEILLVKKDQTTMAEIKMRMVPVFPDKKEEEEKEREWFFCFEKGDGKHVKKMGFLLRSTSFRSVVVCSGFCRKQVFCK